MDVVCSTYLENLQLSTLDRSERAVDKLPVLASPAKFVGILEPGYAYKSSS